MDVAEVPAIRRFQTIDLTTAAWVLPRLVQAYPHLDEWRAKGWLESLVNNNEFLFLYTDGAVALAQLQRSHTLAPKPIVQEHFVFVKDPADKALVARAAGVYSEFLAWSKRLGCDILIVEERSDIPHDLIKAKLGRVFQRQVQYAKVGGA